MNGSTLYSGYPDIERRHTVVPYFGEERRSSAANSKLVYDEAFLLRQASTGNREAFARLYDRYVDKIYKYIYFNVGDRSITEELTARVFMNAWRGLEQDKQARPSLSAWFYRLAHDVLVEYGERRALPESSPSGGHKDAPFSGKGPLAALHQLSNEPRQVLILRFLVGYNTEQVAQILGKPPAAIRAMQHRGLAELGGILHKGAER